MNKQLEARVAKLEQVTLVDGGPQFIIVCGHGTETGFVLSCRPGDKVYRNFETDAELEAILNEIE